MWNVSYKYILYSLNYYVNLCVNGADTNLNTPYSIVCRLYIEYAGLSTYVLVTK